MSFLSDYTEKNSNLIPKIDIPCFAWNSQAEQGLLFFKAKSLHQNVKEVYTMPFSKENTYTTDYIYSLPEGQRAELIDGVIYDMHHQTDCIRNLL